MADFFTPLLLEAFSVINFVWPEAILPGSSAVSNVWTSLQSWRHDLEQEEQSNALGSPGSIAPPYIVLVIGSFTDEANLSMQVRFKRARIHVFYIDSTSTGATQDTIDDKLYALESYIDGRDTDGTHTQFTNFQVQEFGTVDSSESNPWNIRALGTNKTELIGGHVRWEPGWLVGP